MKKNILFLLIVIPFAMTFAKSDVNKKHGKISFITSQNVYLRFENTDGISVGDTAFYQDKRKVIPVMIIEYLSTVSCSGRKIKNIDLKVGDDVFVWSKKDEPNLITKKVVGNEKDSNLAVDNNHQIIKKSKFVVQENRPNFYGNFSANSFSGFANYPNSVGTQRWWYSLNLNAENIAGTPIYFSNYINFSYLTSEWNLVKSNMFNNVKVYNLSVGYKVSKFNVWLGRHINNNISSVGPIDGLQVEKGFGNFAFGGFFGSRPDFTNMAVNSNLLEYGAYINRTDKFVGRQMQNTIAFFQQSNHNKTDRRFLYFQHNDNLISNLYLFVSSEVDLYKVQNNIGKSDFSLTSLFLSTQYTPIRPLTINLSYDARRNIIYYQTFKTLIDSLFNNQLRQGLRLGFFIRPFSTTFINLSGGYSYQPGDLKPSKNINVSITQSEIPFLDISIMPSYNRILSSYSNGYIYGVTITKYIPFNLTSISVGVSKLHYNFGSFTSSLDQKVVNVQISTKIINHIFFNIFYQGEFEGKTTYGNFMSGINYRF